jgi:hypothetical protein
MVWVRPSVPIGIHSALSETSDSARVRASMTKAMDDASVLQTDRLT